MNNSEKDVDDDNTYVPDEDAFDYKGIERMPSDEFEDLYRTYPITEETKCGFWMLKGSCMQK